MKSIFRTAVLVGSVAFAGTDAPAQSRGSGDSRTRAAASAAQTYGGISFPGLRRPQQPPRGSGGHSSGGHHHHHHGHHWHSPYWYGYPYYLDMGPYDLGPYVLPPVYNYPYGGWGYPATGLYSWNTTVVPQRQSTIVVVPPAQANNQAQERDPRPVRVANAETRARALRFVATGDERFAKQEYHSAWERYRQAAQTAPDLAEAYFRQGHALVALGRFDMAAQAFWRAIRLDPNAPLPELSLDTLYDGANITKVNHLERLATEATDQPDNPDLLFALGITLYVNGERDRATPFFERAYDLLAPEDRESLRPMLKELGSDMGGELGEGTDI